MEVQRLSALPHKHHDVSSCSPLERRETACSTWKATDTEYYLESNRILIGPLLGSDSASVYRNEHNTDALRRTLRCRGRIHEEVELQSAPTSYALLLNKEKKRRERQSTCSEAAPSSSRTVNADSRHEHGL
ncbi:unnamed protein product [Pleuronectes platessa]|uniref:Uncharacterized protein n=1 Tax=Pleuronectes platessa TaxID=8262 RepID=A0A9N7VD94_PLEPL|nr:unnamed protein product [Pleuronectes platessa]